MMQAIFIGTLLWIILRALLLLKGKSYKDISIKREIIFNTFVIYCIAVIVVTFPVTPNLRGIHKTQIVIGFIPFVDEISSFQQSTFSLNFKVRILVKNFAGNLLLLLPMGVLLPLLWAKFRSLKKLVMIGVTVSLAIELTQLIFAYFGLGIRTPDIDDVILNTIGAMIGYSLYSEFLIRLRFFAYLE